MKFSTLEKDVIVNLCNWAQTPNEFHATRQFVSQKGLIEGTGLFSFSKEIENRPPTILCIDTTIQNPNSFNSIYNQTLFVLFFLRKLERLGLVTISEGRYSKEKEYAIGTFADASIIGILKVSGRSQWCYSFTYLSKGHNYSLELVEDGLTIRNRDNQAALPYHCMEIFTRFYTFDLVSSNIALEQELFELVKNNFKTNDEIMLETANHQLDTACKILKNAEIQTNKAIENVEQSKRQFETAQNSAKEQFETAQNNAREQFETAQNNAREQFETAQNNAREQFETAQNHAREQFETAQDESIRQFKSANRKSNIALGLAVLSIIMTPIVAKWIPLTIDEEQYLHSESIRTEELYSLKELNNQSIKLDTDLIILSKKVDTISTIIGDMKMKVGKKTKQLNQN